MVPNGQTIPFEDVRIIFRNFECRESEFNELGSKNFSLVLDGDLAEAMLQDGWNVKMRPPREEGDDPLYHLPVAVGYKIRPPRVVMITTQGKTSLGEDMVGLLDWADIIKVDMIIRASHWNKGGKSGVKAYLQSLYATIREDELELKYADVPDAGAVESEEPPF